MMLIVNMRTFYEEWQPVVNRQPAADELSIDERQLLAVIRQPIADELDWADFLRVPRFKPAHLGQLAFYLSVLDKTVKKPHENPSVGLVLCREMDRTVVELAIRDYTKPMGVATFRLGEDAPEEYNKILPDTTGLDALMKGDLLNEE